MLSQNSGNYEIQEKMMNLRRMTEKKETELKNNFIKYIIMK